MGLFDKLQKSIQNVQDKIDNLDMNEVNDKFIANTNGKVENIANKIDKACESVGETSLEGKKTFTCAVCGDTDSIGSKKTVYGKICYNCIEKLEEKNIEPKAVKNYTLDQIKAICNSELSAYNVAQQFVVENPPIALLPDEKCYYVGDACGAKIKTLTTGYVGARKGTSIRIMKGVSYHTGGSKGQAVREQVLETSEIGTFVMTGNRFILMTSQYGFEVAGNKITSVEMRPDGFAIYEKNKTHIVLSDDVSKIALVMQVLTAATLEQEQQKSLESESVPKKQGSKKSSKSTETVLSGADEIRKYKQLMDDGIITEEEFEKKKKQILGI